MDFENLSANVNKIVNAHYSFGRSTEHVVIHYNAGNPSVEDCYSVWRIRERIREEMIWAAADLAAALLCLALMPLLLPLVILERLAAFPSSRGPR